MKTIFNYAIPMIISLFVSTLVLGQSSKSCGACHETVSSSAKVGDYCPHCRVRWGYENTTTRNVNSYTHNTSYNQNMSRTAYVTSNSNLRAFASKNAYVQRVIPQFSTVTVLGKQGDWYHVQYGGTSWYNGETGYIHKSLIQSY